MTGSNHHIVPKLYLKWFTLEKKPVKQLWCFDNKQRTRALEPIKKLATVTDFNTVELPGIAPMHFEQLRDELIESPAARVLYQIWKQGTLPPANSENFRKLLRFIALLYVCNPTRRESYMAPLRRLQLVKEELQAQLDQDRELGIKRDYPRLGAAALGRPVHPFEVEPTRTAQVMREFISLDSFENALSKRAWHLISVSDTAGHLVTSDMPVMVLPASSEQDNIRPQGIGAYGTRLFFPLNCCHMLVGTLGVEGVSFIADEQWVRKLNTLTVHLARRFVYSPAKDFETEDEDGRMIKASTLFGIDDNA